MKYLVLGIALLILACTPGKPKSTKATKGILLYQSGKGYTLFFNATDTSFYLIQHMDMLEVPSTCGFVAYKKDSLTIRDLSTSLTIRYQLDENIFGIGSYIGNELLEFLMNNTSDGITFRTDLSDLIGLMPCLCYPVGEVHTCAHGGLGAQSCEHRLGRKVGYKTWIHICQVTCSQGYDACCN